MKAFRAPICEVEIAEGIPGSGKSLFGVERTLHAIIQQRRPVFTSLPIRWPVMREYLRLKGGCELAGLLFEVDEAHFRAFLERAACWQRFRQKFMRRREHRKPESVLRRMFDEEHGPPIIAPDPKDADVQPNWIPPFSQIILDEVHHWFHQRDQARETPDLGTYLTMHRHFMHSILAMSQDRMQISISFRRLAAAYWTVRDRGKDKLVWGVRFKHLGVNATGYAKFTPDQEKAATKLQDVEPIEQFTRFRNMPNVRWMFRLYDSYTHAGSAEAMRQEMRAVRRAAGLSDEGGFLSHINTPEVRRMSKKLLASVAVSSAILGVMTGIVIRPDVPPPEPPPPADLEDTGPPEFATWPRWSSLRDGEIRLDGQPVRVGETYNGITNVFASRRDRLSVLVRGGHVWLWRYGEPTPTRLGEPDAVHEQLRGLLRNSPSDRRARQPAQSGHAPEAVEPSPG